MNYAACGPREYSGDRWLLLKGEMVEHKILGFSGHRGAGKDTAARAIVDALPRDSASVLPFAAALKDVVRRCFIPADWPLATSDLSEEIDKAAMLPCGRTVRQVLQLVGTDWFRELWPDVWINAWKVGLSHAHTSIVLVPDVRFPNELAVIQALGGHVIRLTRTPYSGDQHASEKALDDTEDDTLQGHRPSADRTVFGLSTQIAAFDALINNRDMSIQEMQDAVLLLVRQKGWLEGL